MNSYALQQTAAQHLAAPRGDASPDTSALHGICRRIAEVEVCVRDLHGIADRACGAPNTAENKPAPQAVPNGMLEEIENALDILMALSSGAVARLSRIA